MMKSYTYTVDPLGSHLEVTQDSESFKDLIKGYERLLSQYNDELAKENSDWHGISVIDCMLTGYEMAFLNLYYGVHRVKIKTQEAVK